MRPIVTAARETKRHPVLRSFNCLCTSILLLRSYTATKRNGNSFVSNGHPQRPRKFGLVCPRIGVFADLAKPQDRAPGCNHDCSANLEHGLLGRSLPQLLPARLASLVPVAVRHFREYFNPVVG